jgi:alkaline phosphatase
VTYRRRAYWLAAVVILLAGPAKSAERPKNVILLIGDGMGVGHVTLARLAAQAGGESLAMDTMRTAAWVQTRSADSVATDSAAAATAIATGWKTDNGMVAMLPDGTSVASILEVARQLKKSTGLVTDAEIVSATPAAFAANIRSREELAEIAGQILQRKVDVLLGGGRAFFTPQSQPGSLRRDESDLLARATREGYAVVGTRDELMQKRSGRVLGLFAMGLLTAGASEPSLAELAGQAIQALSGNRHGFFLLVEGDLIDVKAHDHDTMGVIRQVRALDSAVGVALAFARRRQDTLVVVVADHDTGGLVVLPSGEGSPGGWSAAWSTDGHSGNNVPLLADGPGAPEFGGVMDNTAISRTIARLWKAKDYPRKLPDLNQP